MQNWNQLNRFIHGQSTFRPSFQPTQTQQLSQYPDLDPINIVPFTQNINENFNDPDLNDLENNEEFDDDFSHVQTIDEQEEAQVPNNLNQVDQVEVSNSFT